MSCIITLTTDFGLADGFVGAMKGVILGINPCATIIDISHEVAPQNIEQGAFVLANAYKYFPANAIHVIVVDPGVGSARRPIAAQVGETIFVAPDNGILSLVASHWSLVVDLNRSEYFLSQVSRTFHGRDIFAPVAAHLSLGVPLASLGDPIMDWIRLASPIASRIDNQIVGRVVHIDHFGNAITNIAETLLMDWDRASLTIRVSANVLRGVASTYAMVSEREPLALISSSGNLEIAVRNGNAAQQLGLHLGDLVSIDVPF